ncbi:2-amino-3-carboxymuconate-6-semialdehyde decarboxylase [Penicillium subrubescens]|uniref:2-amino-3-carboxymuconate-6-semialdehyde decarboxylase n=2 Tax=Penicillium subrubescens TaxID=1316194 RepID=A0A1Q5SWC9_9EURO|nr:2-amino-3-carboxymuconate-6-semialdehyde decarboxylase [Penicillium subrubescens]
MISAGFPVKNGTLYNDGAPVPEWSLSSHISAMDSLGVNYSTLSITAPGVSFIKDAKKAKSLARSINLLLQEFTQTYPTRLGALCLLPLPYVNEAVEELRFCIDSLKFVGVGLYTNANGTYLGDPTLDPIFSALSTHNASVFVHPASPSCRSVALSHPIPMTEYPFDTVRAMENLLLTGQRAKYPDLKMIFAHGGGAMPYLASRIAGVATLSYAGGIPFAETMAQLAGYYFDLASATSAIQLTALKSFIGAGKLVTGIDYPYVPLAQAVPGLTGIQKNGNFTDEEMTLIKYDNALEIFPRISSALKLK